MSREWDHAMTLIQESFVTTGINEPGPPEDRKLSSQRGGHFDLESLEHTPLHAVNIVLGAASRCSGRTELGSYWLDDLESELWEVWVALGKTWPQTVRPQG